MSPVNHSHTPSASDETASEFAAWNDFVAEHPSGNLLQTAEWGMLKADFGWEWELVTLGDRDAPEAGAVILYRQLPMQVGTLAYIPRGPVVDWSDETRVTRLWDVIEQALRRHRAWACWMEPQILDDSVAETRLTQLGFSQSRRTIQPRSTIIIDISPSEEEVMMEMKSKTRYNIRLSGRKDVEVREGGIEDVEIFYDLMETTGERNEFGIHTRAYYRRAFELFKRRDQVALLLAEYEGQPLAGLMTFAVGDTAWYISGASSNRHRKRMPTYAIQWAAIRWAKDQGCTRYDLWGIPDANESTLEEEFTERSDGLWGVYRFKRGFGGEVVRYTGLWERSLNRLYPLASHLYEQIAQSLA